MTTHIYRRVADQAKRLSRDEQWQLVEELLEAIRHREEGHRKHSIKELKGLGKELWRSVDVDKYLEEERNSWD
jgi:hypothetical protein